MYLDGHVYGKFTARHLPFNIGADTVMERWFWDLSRNTWGDRGPREPFSIWSDDQTFTIDIERVWLSIKSQRYRKLAESDWTQFTDAPFTPEQKNAWAAYRQELRNIPETFSSAAHPDEVVWPTKPE